MSVTAILAVIIFVAACDMIASEKVNRAVVALSGAAAMVLVGATSD